MTGSRSTEQAADSGVVASADGTGIAWARQGSGPTLVMVHCVATSRRSTPQPTLPEAFADRFTVLTYDRRGTGESTDGASPYALEREIEDLVAVMSLGDERPLVYGFSSGAVLALLAAEAGAPIGRLLLLEPPLTDEADPDGQQAADAQRRVDDDVRAAMTWFHRDVVGVPEEIIAGFPDLNEEQLRNARTIVHELTFLPGTPAARFAHVATPTTVVASDATVPEMIEWNRELAAVMPNAELRVVPGEWHGVDDATLVGLARESTGV